ncbi:virulence factor Mce family protein [Nocardioides sp. CF8]|uniref:MCE family protein n=1 Tax=Nocardioides sp. CF8 TaxID=110319 RepID=UPI00032D6D49|nr:MCE family protein [Nocardioides sp. CF8]EON25346.1 virulence factor Mce family protein [Nocardioides sp. CF8]
MDLIKKLAVPLVVLALVTAAVLTMIGSDDSKRLVAHFPRAVSVYEGSEVRVLGVAIGTVEEVKPSGTDVEVTMAYDADINLPADAQAAIVAPSIVGDRFVQLTPVFQEGDEVMPDNTELALSQTAVPIELDQIFESLDTLNVALGPNGANENGALSDLLAVTADNFEGQGANFNSTLKNFARLSDTLADNKEELFGSAEQLGKFIETLAENDQTVRGFNQSLADVSALLKGEREELTASLKNLSTALTQVSSFVTDNREVLGRNIKGLNRVSKVLVKQRDALDTVLKVGPLALNNLALTYNPQAGTLDTRANLGMLGSQIEADPAAFLCGFTDQVKGAESVCDTIEQILPRSGAFKEGTTLPAAPGLEFDPTLGGLVEVQR